MTDYLRIGMDPETHERVVLINGRPIRDLLPSEGRPETQFSRDMKKAIAAARRQAHRRLFEGDDG